MESDLEVDVTTTPVKRPLEDPSESNSPQQPQAKVMKTESSTSPSTKLSPSPKRSPSPAKPGTSRKRSPSPAPGRAKRSPSPKPGEVKKQPSVEAREEDGKAKRQEEERLKMQVLVSNFTEDQLNRYEMFRRAAFPKASVKRLMQSITGSNIAQNVVIAMAGMTKVFVGEIVETALDVKEQWGDEGPIQPKHLREAVRRLKSQDVIPNGPPRVLPDS